MEYSSLHKTYEPIPEKLKKEKRWCLYKIIPREGKNTKLPIMPNSKPAKSNDKSTWHSYEECMKALSRNIGDGLGFFLGDGYIGIDIDKVSDEMIEYMVDKDAKSMTADFLRGISTYAEVSPSKTGLHFIGKGHVPGERKRYKNLEIYDEGRFFTVTGNVIKDKDRSHIKPIEKELLPLYQKYMPDMGNQREENKTRDEKRNNTITRTRESSFIQRYKQSSYDVLDLLFERGYFRYTGEEIRQIYQGNYEAYFSSQSEADFFMLQRLLYYIADVEQAILLMENSGLKREKWYKKRAGTDYIHYIANKAISSMNTFYDWNRSYGKIQKNHEFKRNKERREDEHSKNNEEVDKMPRYSMEKISDILSHSLEEIRHDQEAYQDFLRTMGNNYKYPYMHQLSIYSTYKDSTACAEYDFWTSIGRVVKRGEHGIPLLDVSGNQARVKYIFDVSQTVSIGNKISEIKLWKYDSKKHLPAIDHLIDSFKEKNSSLIFSQEEKLSSLISLYTKREFYSMVDILTDDTLRRYTKIELSQFIQESLKVAIAQRMGIELPIDEEKLRPLSGIVYEQDIDSLLGDISSLSKEILIDIGREIGKINEREKLEEIQEKEQTEKDKERYNNVTEDRTSRKEHIDSPLEGGLEDERNSDVGREGIFTGGRDLYSNSQGKSVRETGRDLPIGEDGGGRGSSDTKYSDAGDNRPEQAQSVWEGKAEISQGEQTKPISDHVLQRNVDGSSTEHSGASGGFYRDTRAKDDGGLGTDQSAQVGRFSEVRRTEEESGHDTHKDGTGTNHLGIESKLQENTKKEEGEVQATSFSFAQNTGRQGRFQLPLRQEEIDTVLIHGGNEDLLRLKVLAEYSKGKSVEELADFLQRNFQGGNGYEVEGNKVCAWYDTEGIYLSNDTSSKENPSQVFSWIDAANRIGELIEKGQYATNVEVAEAFSHERKELAEMLWFLNKDLADEVKQSYLSLLNQTEKSGFPDQTEELTEKLSSAEFRNTLKKEYETFLQDYDTDPSILRFHYHKLNDILQRIQDLEILRKELTSSLTEIPNIKSFITEDEMDENLRRGSGISGGKERIIEFFGKSHTLQEKMDFLKNEYGTGGRSHALSGARGSGEWHDAKGIKLEKEHCKDSFLNWNQVAKRIQTLIESDRYIEKEELTEQTEDREDIKENIADRNESFKEESVSEIGNRRDYWVVEFNEGLGLIEKNYAGELVTKELLDEIKELDEKIRVHNKTVGEDEY